MKLFNIGIPELIFILVISLIVLGPDGIVKTARTLGKTIRKVIRSPIWSMMIDTQRELREMPTKLVREAGIEEDLAELKKTSRELQKVNRDIQKAAPPLTVPRPTPNVILPPPLSLPHKNRERGGPSPCDGRKARSDPI
jgi:sec-independent protein translocase protein TatB